MTLAELLAVDGLAPPPDFRPSPDQLAVAILAALQGVLQRRFIDSGFLPAIRTP